MTWHSPCNTPVMQQDKRNTATLTSEQLFALELAVDCAKHGEKMNEINLSQAKRALAALKGGSK